jgi:hypothetical protein
MNFQAVAWLEAMFNTCSREILDPRSTHIGPMFTLRNDIEPCQPMSVDSIDYKDPERVWL